MMQFNSNLFYGHLSTKDSALANNKDPKVNKRTDKIRADSLEKFLERDRINKAEIQQSNYFLLALYLFTLLTVVLFTHFIYLRKYKKLILHLRELNKENKEIKTNNRNLSILNSQLENQSGIKLKQMEDLNTGNKTIRSQHEKMLEYNFSLERIIEERTKQISELSQQLSIKSKLADRLVYIISRKTLRPVASLKGLIYLLDTPSIKPEDYNEFSKRIKTCVMEMEDLFNEFDIALKKEKEYL
jgi:hypothetical protein